MVLKWELLSPPKNFTNWSACPFFLSGHTSAPYCQGLLSNVVCHQLHSFSVYYAPLSLQTSSCFASFCSFKTLLWLYGKLHCTPVWLPLTCPLFCNSTLNECVVYTQVPGHTPVCRHSFILVPWARVLLSEASNQQVLAILLVLLLQCSWVYRSNDHT